MNSAQLSLLQTLQIIFLQLPVPITTTNIEFGFG